MHLPLHSRIALLVVAFACAELARSSPLIVAHIDGEEITVDSLDAMSTKQVQHIHGRLLEVAQHAAQALVDRRLGIEDLPASILSSKRAQLYRERNVKVLLPDAKALETKLPDELTIALVGDERIPASAFEQEGALRLYRLRGELFLQRRRSLDALIEQRLLQLEARHRGVSVAEMERSLSQPKPITDAELHAYVASQRAEGRIVENPERARAYLEFKQTYQRRSRLLQQIRARTQIRIELQPPERPRLVAESADGVPLGAAAGPMLVVYSNYQCGICRATHLQIDRLLGSRRPPRIVLHDFVDDPTAIEAAAAVRCAAQTGRADVVRKHLLARKPPARGQRWFDATDVESLARLAATSVANLQACMTSRNIRASIQHDTRAARRLGFDEPPAFVAAGVPLSGMQGAEQLAAALSGNAEEPLSP